MRKYCTLLLFCLAALVPPPLQAEEKRDETEAIALADALLAYLNNPKTNIFQDDAALTRFFSKRMLQLCIDARNRAAVFTQAHPDEPTDPADNSSILNAWDRPTTLEVRGAKPDEKGVAVACVFKWGPETNYPGEERAVTLYVRKEGDAWKVDEILHHKSKFSEQTTLSEHLESGWK